MVVMRREKSRRRRRIVGSYARTAAPLPEREVKAPAAPLASGEVRAYDIAALTDGVNTV